MYVKAISWMGVKTEKFDELTRFFREVLNLPVMSEERDFVVFQLPNKDQVEVFGPSGPNQDFVPDSPVCGFLVDDIEQARDELIQAGIVYQCSQDMSRVFYVKVAAIPPRG